MKVCRSFGCQQGKNRCGRPSCEMPDESFREWVDGLSRTFTRAGTALLILIATGVAAGAAWTLWPRYFNQ